MTMSNGGGSVEVAVAAAKGSVGQQQQKISMGGIGQGRGGKVMISVVRRWMMAVKNNKDIKDGSGGRRTAAMAAWQLGGDNDGRKRRSTTTMGE